MKKRRGGRWEGGGREGKELVAAWCHCLPHELRPLDGNTDDQTNAADLLEGRGDGGMDGGHTSTAWAKRGGSGGKPSPLILGS